MTWLNHEHQQFESAVYRCRSICDDKNWGLVRTLFQEFVESYGTHVRLEEDVVFAMYEERAGTSSEPTDSLRTDHAQIANLCKHIHDLLERGDWQHVPREISLLYRCVIRHHEKEEEIFLPMASEVLLSDKEEVLSRLKPA